MLKFKYAQWLVNYLVGLIINNIIYENILTTKLFFIAVNENNIFYLLFAIFRS